MDTNTNQKVERLERQLERAKEAHAEDMRLIDAISMARNVAEEERDALKAEQLESALRMIGPHSMLFCSPSADGQWTLSTNPYNRDPKGRKVRVKGSAGEVLGLLLAELRKGCA